MDTMNKSLITALLLSCATTAYAETPKRTAFIFASFRDTTATDPIDKNVTWRNVAMTYQSIRGLGIPGDEIYIFYNDIKPNKEDNSISLKVELDAHTLYPGEYSKLEEIFKEKTNNLSSKDEVILTTLSHGADGILYCDYGSRVSGLELSRLVNTTQARTAAYYSACYSQLILDRSIAKNAVLASSTDRRHMCWSDRNYCNNSDYFEAFTKKEADTDGNGKVSFEEASEFVHGKWDGYMKNFLENYLISEYKYPIGFNYPREAMIKDTLCYPQIKRSRAVPTSWTLEKK